MWKDKLSQMLKEAKAMAKHERDPRNEVVARAGSWVMYKIPRGLPAVPLKVDLTPVLQAMGFASSAEFMAQPLYQATMNATAIGGVHKPVTAKG